MEVRGAGMTETALAESYRTVWLAVNANEDRMRAGELCRVLGLGSTPAKVEGCGPTSSGLPDGADASVGPSGMQLAEASIMIESWIVFEPALRVPWRLSE